MYQKINFLLTTEETFIRNMTVRVLTELQVILEILVALGKSLSGTKKSNKSYPKQKKSDFNQMKITKDENTKSNVTGDDDTPYYKVGVGSIGWNGLSIDAFGSEEKHFHSIKKGLLGLLEFTPSYGLETDGDIFLTSSQIDQWNEYFGENPSESIKPETPSSLNMVASFMELFGQPIPDKPCIPVLDRCKLRVELIREELAELEYDGIKAHNMVEVFDALIDLRYVSDGCILEFGLGDIFDEGVAEVHRSNMSKGCDTLDQANRTVAHYLDLDGTRSHIKQNDDGTFLVLRDDDHKILKNVDYSPADLLPILKKGGFIGE